MTTSYRLFSLLNATAFSLLTSAQCPMGNVYLDTQAEVDAFGANYPNCTVLPGSLNIDGPDITDLSAFNDITRIEGMLQLNSLPLSDISAFNQLSVAGELWIWQCPSLTSITGFTTLDTVGTVLALFQNNAMSTLDAFPDLDVCGVNLLIGENALLTSIGGFGELDSVGTLTFSYNPQLTDIPAFDQIFVIVNQLEMLNNTALSPCNVQAICDYVTANYPSADPIFGNAPGCTDEDEIYTSCIALATEMRASTPLGMHPNPTNGTLYVDGIPRNGTPASITDHLGRLVQWIMISNGTLDVRALESGMYVLRLAVDGRPEQFRFVRE